MITFDFLLLLSLLHLLHALLLQYAAVVLYLGHRRLLLGFDHGALPVSLCLLKLAKWETFIVSGFDPENQLIAVSMSERSTDQDKSTDYLTKKPGF